MERENIRKKLNDVFIDIFDDENIIIDEKTSSEDIDGWDSLEHINLIVAVEQKFNIKFSMKDVISMNNVGDMMNIISSKIYLNK